MHAHKLKCMHTHTHTHTYTHIHTKTHTHIRTPLHGYIQTYRRVMNVCNGLLFHACTGRIANSACGRSCWLKWCQDGTTTRSAFEENTTCCSICSRCVPAEEHNKMTYKLRVYQTLTPNSKQHACAFLVLKHMHTYSSNVRLLL